MNNAELHERTLEVLTKLVPVLDCDELALLCWHCGIQPMELMPVKREFDIHMIKEIRNECAA